MKRKDVSDKKYKLRELPHTNRCNRFLEEFIIPEYIAFYVGSGYYHNSLWESSFKRHFNSALDLFNYRLENEEETIKKVLNILETKYCLKVDVDAPRIRAIPL